MRLLLTAVVLVLLALPASAQLATPDTNGITYDHVHLNVADIDVHKKLWVEHFGGVVVQKGPLTAIRLPNFLIGSTSGSRPGDPRGRSWTTSGSRCEALRSF